jgi:hypothetical protein
MDGRRRDDSGVSALLNRRCEIGRPDGGIPAWHTLAVPPPGGASRAMDGRRRDDSGVSALLNRRCEI